MVTDIRVVRGRDCVRTTAEGTLDLAASQRILAEVVAAGHELHRYDVIFDARRTVDHLSVVDLWDLAHHLAGIPEMRERKIAVLPPTDDFDRADLFARFSRTHGLQVRSFESFEDAVDWLEMNRTSRPR